MATITIAAPPLRTAKRCGTSAVASLTSVLDKRNDKKLKRPFQAYRGSRVRRACSAALRRAGGAPSRCAQSFSVFTDLSTALERSEGAPSRGLIASDGGGPLQFQAASRHPLMPRARRSRTRRRLRLVVLPRMVRYEHGHDNRFLEGTSRDPTPTPGEIPIDSGDTITGCGDRRGPCAGASQAGTVVAPSGRMAHAARLGERHQCIEGAPRGAPP